MQPLNSYEVINFFEWIKNSNKDSGKIGEIREIICIAKYNSKIVEKIQPLIKEYIDKNNKSFNSFELSESILIYLYNYGDCEEKEKIEQALWSDDELPKKSSKLLNLMIDEKNKDREKRYGNPDIFKCVILSYVNDENLKELVESFYEKLNNSSGDYLDIFYSKKELLDSGFKTKQKIEKLNIPDSQVPCIAIWKDDIEKYDVIPIDGLNSEGLLKLLLIIIDIIKLNNNITPKCVAELAKKEYKELKSFPNYLKSSKKPKEPIRVKLLWLILVPIVCAIISGIVSGISVYYITKHQKIATTTDIVACQKI